MEKAQSVNSNVWDSVSRTEQLLQDLEEMEASLNSLQVNDLPDVAFISRALFTWTQKHAAEIAGNKFQGMELKPGWLITSGNFEKFGCRKKAGSVLQKINLFHSHSPLFTNKQDPLGIPRNVTDPSRRLRSS